MEKIQIGCEDGVGEDATSGNWCTVTPQRQRRPLQQLNYSSTASPRPNVSVTPYKYHRCRVILEESENDENIDPCRKHMKNSVLHSKMQTNASCKENAVKDESSPFAYPVIWESHQVVSSSQALLSQTDSVKTKCSLGPTSPVKPSTLTTAQRVAESVDFPGQLTSDISTSMESKTDKEFRDERETVKGTNGEKFPIRYTPSSSSGSHSKSGSSSTSSLSQFGQMVTPSKSTPTPPPSDRPIFLTPSERFKRSSDCRGAVTPQRRKQNTAVNPFEVAVDCLHLPAVSPSLFQQVVSPSQKVDTNFRWSIDQLAVLKPANIETSPYNQAEFHDPDYEQQAQDAIDRFFNHQSVVPSPWTGNQKSVNLLQMVCTPVNPVSSQPKPRTNTVWCQTELSLPPTLPDAIEEALKPFTTFTQDQWLQGSSEDEGSSLNNTTLRRKLLFSQDELLNATPMGSPSGVDTADPVDGHTSPVGSFLLHEDDDIESVDEQDHNNLLWCGAIVNPGDIGNSKRDPQLARHPPPTPPSHMVSDSNDPCAELKVHTDHSMLICSPNLSPVQANHFQDSGGSVFVVASPDVSPIHCHQYALSESPKDFVISSHLTQDPSIDDALHGQFMSSFTMSSSQSVPSMDSNTKQSPSCTLPFYPALYVNTGTSDQEMVSLSPRSNCSQSSILTMRLQQNLEFAVKCQASCSRDNSYENTCCVTEASQDGAIERKEFYKERSDSLRTTPKIKKVPSPCRIFDSEPSADISLSGYDEATHYQQSKEDSNEKQNNSEGHDEEQKTPVKTGEQRSTSGHFSSSPIKEDGSSPLALDTPRKRFSSSPPLSPILCRSVMFLPHQENQQKSQLKSHISISQSTHMSIEIEGKSCTEEDILMEDEQYNVKQPLRHPQIAMLRRSSSVSDMETDSNPSLEVNTSGEIVSQDTGYQTGSLHTTNFSLSTFANDNGTSTPMCHLKENVVNLAKQAGSADNFLS